MEVGLALRAPPASAAVRAAAAPTRPRRAPRPAVLCRASSSGGDADDATAAPARRRLLAGLAAAAAAAAAPREAAAAGAPGGLPGFKKDLNKGRRGRAGAIPPEAFKEGPEGLRYADVEVGKGALAKEGDRVAVHYDCKWKGVTFITTRQGMGVTGGSPVGFSIGVVGPGGAGIRGLDLGVRGMRVGGQRRLVVPPKLAYGSKGVGEIPPNAELTVDVALLSIKTNAFGSRVKVVEG